MFFQTLGLALFVSLFSCREDPQYFDPYAQYQNDVALIKDYVADRQWDAIDVDSTGVFMVFTELADSTSVGSPSANGSITIAYTGMLLDGTVFDKTQEGDSVTFLLAGLIPGWQIAIPKMRAGDRAKLLIPSYYAYGPSVKPGLPANSVLIFDISLISFAD